MESQVSHGQWDFLNLENFFCEALEFIIVRFVFKKAHLIYIRTQKGLLGGLLGLEHTFFRRP